MFITILSVVGAVTLSQAATPAAPAGRALKDLPNTTVAYYDIQGRNPQAVEKSLKKVLADPAIKQRTQLFSWNVGAQLTKVTTGAKCTIQSAKANMTATANLPRLAEESKISKDLLKAWQGYVATVESDAAANLWFISDHLKDAEKAMAGIPCEQANATWNGGIDKIKTDLSAFATERAKATAAAAAAKKASEKQDDAEKPEEY